MAPRVLWAHHVERDRAARERTREIVAVRARREGGTGQRASSRNRRRRSLAEHRHPVVPRQRIQKPYAIRVQITDEDDVEHRRRWRGDPPKKPPVRRRRKALTR